MGEGIERKRRDLGIGWKKERGKRNRIEEGKQENEAKRPKERKWRGKKKGLKGRNK